MNLNNYYLIMMLLILLMIFIFMENFLMFLIGLEFMLMFYLMLTLIIMGDLNNDWMFLYMLVMGVCESVVGISLMISIVHSYGTQSMKVLNLKW
uniref:NADH-ubiquinone oxidoreductase chain 4L n=1 Tax=Seladonia aeraria TaxID=1310367 RepID=A0A7T9KR77_9HYME|nr:NADH dehydrogenase subunit 4L [Seladonia aeraria]QQS74777.1 NADH dehydrogenase subunit 4L [Seladonia aeraria]